MAPILRIRGLPYSATADDVIDFFKDVTIKGGKRGISFPQGPNGRSNGEAFVELDNENDIERAMAHHKEHMGRRYIEVFRSDEAEMKRAMGWQPDRNRKEFFARLRGLPYDTEKQDIFRFFNDLTIAPDGIGLLVDHLGRCTGDAYVQFTSAEMLARAKEKHLEKIGRRYIEIFDATGMEASMAIRKQHELNKERSGVGPMMRHGARGDRGYYGNPPPPPPGPPGPPYRGYGGDGGYGYGGGGPRGPPRPCPYSRPYGYDQRPPSPRGPYGPPSMDSGGGSGPYGSPRGGGLPPHVVHMRGLPFQATTDEIAVFFTPVQPVNITLRYNAQGRPTGEADAEFATHDEAKEAMKKDREKIGTRYIELFLDSIPSHGMSQSPGYIGGGGSSAGTSWNYGPPFYGGGSTAPPTPGGGANGAPTASVGRYNGGGRAPGGPPSRGYYDSPNDAGSGSAGYYGTGGGDYGYAPPPPSGPVDDRYGGVDVRRNESGSGGGYGAPPPSSAVPSKVEAADDGYDRYEAPREMENYYW